MLWQEIQSKFPAQWTLIEAIHAHSKENVRVLEDLSVVETFENDGNQALRKYVELHKRYKDREFYVVHTSRPDLNIQEQNWLGIRSNTR